MRGKRIDMRQRYSVGLTKGLNALLAHIVLLWIFD